MSNIKIQKSYKFEGYAFVFEDYKNPVKRKIANTKGGQYVCYKSNVYEVKWESDESNAFASLIVNKGPYKEYAAKLGITNDSSEEIEIANEILSKVRKPKLEVEIDLSKPVKHEKYDTIKTCIDSDIPVYLVGPAGSGKNHTLEAIAKELEMEFYFTNSVQQEFKITGFIDAGGKYHETEFYRAFKNGGLFFLDEMDASIPEVLVLLNAAIANKYFEFPNGKINAHPDFRVVAAGNTMGSGADEQYVGRLVLDQATLDRFVIIEFDYDRNIEIHLAKGNTELVDYIRQLRDKSKQVGVRSTFSYRCITMVVKLENQLPLKEVLKMAVFKGLDIDTVNTLKVYGSTKYHTAI